MTTSTIALNPSASRPRRLALLGALDPAAILATTAVLLGGNGIVIAYRMAEDAEGHGHFAVFWVSYALVLAGVLALVLRARTTPARVWTLAGYGVLTFVPKLLMTLDGPRYFDEYGHWRHVNDMIHARALFVDTPHLPIERAYPGLEAVTAALHSITRLDTWRAGQVVVLAAHVGVLIVIWWTARQLDLSSRAAAVVAVLYALNPSYLYFDTQYSYESLGLPLCFTTVGLAIAARRAGTRASAAWCAAGSVLAAGACIVTHHNSAFVMVVLLAVTAALVPRREGAAGATLWLPWVVTGAALLVIVIWLATAASDTYDYLEPHLRSGIGDTLNFLRGRSTRSLGDREIETSRTIFAGSGLPVYEILCGVLAPLVGLAALGYALAGFWRERASAVRHVRLFAPFYALLVLYAVSMPLVLAASGAETAHRAWGYGYLGLAMIVVSTSDRWLELAARLPRRRVYLAVSALLLVVAVGNTAAGQNLYYRFPGPDVFGTDTRSRSVELDGVAAWMDDQLPAGAKVITDRFTSEAILGYTRLRVPEPAEYLVFRIYLEGGEPGPRLRSYLADHHFDYFVLDRRIGHEEPKQKLFQGYVGEESVSTEALRTVGRTPFLRVVHRTPRYLVLRIRP